jgi:hypothetical protein
MPCKQPGSIGGLSINVLSGTSLLSPICELDSRTDVKHIVDLQNLQTYRVKITCKGFITSIPNSVKFDASPKNVNDTDKKWDATVTLGDMGQKTFTHVNLQSISSTGSESVDTQIDAHWFQRRPDNTETITISVEI